jgi:hypothetical protein
MNKTAMQLLLKQIKNELAQINKNIELGTENPETGKTIYSILEVYKIRIERDFLNKERNQIESAYNNAKNYPDPNCDGGKYYFMNYISND